MEMCRLCLLTLNESVCYQIFDYNSNTMSKILTCVPLHLAEEDNLPSKICIPCFDKVNEFYDFRMKVMESDRKLKKLKDDHTDDKLKYVYEKSESIKDEYNEPSNSDYKWDINIDKISVAIQTDEILGLALLSTNENIKMELQNHDEYPEIDIEQDPFKIESIHGDEKLFDCNTSDRVSSINSCSDSENSEYLIPMKRRKSSLISMKKNKLKNQRLNNKSRSGKKRSIKMTEKIFITCDPDYMDVNNKISVNEEKLIKRSNTELEIISKDIKLEDEKLQNNNVEKSWDSSSNEDNNINKTNLICCVCFRKFSEKSEILVHYRLHYRKEYTLKHIDKRRKLFNCKICNESCSTKFAFDNHAKTHNFKPYKCSLCEKVFISTKLIFKHGQNVHANELLPDSSKTDIKDLTLKSSIKRYICDICDETFNYVKYLSSHREEKHPESKDVKMAYRCLYCNNTYVFERSLRRHFNSHVNKRLLCNTCGKHFTSEDGFRRHLKIHTGIKPYKCGICGMAFVDREHHKLHERTHTGERPYVCSHCGKAFARRPTLTVHERQHTGTKPYICTFCNKGFVVKGQLTTHLKHCKNKKHST